MSRAMSRFSRRMARGPSCGTGPRSACLGCGRKAVSGFDRCLWSGRGRPRQPARRPSGAKADGQAASRDGRRASTRAEGRARAGVEPDHLERWRRKSGVQSSKSKVVGRRVAAAAGKTIFCNSGFEAVEAALKTAMLATGKPGVIAFEGAYHGLGYGALNATQRAHFRSPFRGQLREFGASCRIPS